MKTILILMLTIALNSYGQTTAEEYSNSAISKANLGDYIGAIVDYTKAIELNSTLTH
jgi:hypothetical protein